MFKLWCEWDMFSYVKISLILGRIVIFNSFVGIECHYLQYANHRILIISCDCQEFSKSMKGICNYLSCVRSFIVFFKGIAPWVFKL